MHKYHKAQKWQGLNFFRVYLFIYIKRVCSNKKFLLQLMKDLINSTNNFFKQSNHLLECDVVGVPVFECPVLSVIDLLHESSNLTMKLLCFDQEVRDNKKRNLHIIGSTRAKSKTKDEAVKGHNIVLPHHVKDHLSASEAIFSIVCTKK